MAGLADRARRRVAALALALLTAGLVAGLGAAPAQAGHAQLIGTTPASGQTVPNAPSSVTLTFSGTVISLGLQFQVIGPAGLVSSGPPVIDRGTVTQPLSSSLPNGNYLVNWHVVHDDGHPDSGSFGFVIDVAGGAQATDASGRPITGAPVPPIAAGNGGQASEPEPAGLPPVLIVLGVLIVAVVVVVAVIADRRRRNPLRS